MDEYTEYWIDYLIDNNDNDTDNNITDEYDNIEMYESDYEFLSTINNN